MAALVMMLGLGFGLSATLLNKAMTVLLRKLGFGLHGPSKTTAVAVLLPRGQLRQASQNKMVPWPDLLPELLGLVLLRMPSHADRIRFSAVCRQWRSCARLQPLPPLPPLIALRTDRFLSLPDGAVHPMPPTAEDFSYRLSTGSMLFLVHDDGSCCLMNPFSRETTPQQINTDTLNLKLGSYGSYQIGKVVVSDHVVVVLTRGKRNSKNVNIFARRPPQGAAGSCPTIEWVPPGNSYVADIALFQGKLYVLVAHYDEFLKLPELYVLYISEEQTGVRSVQCIPSTARDPSCTASNKTNLFFYLAVCGDRLLLVERQVDHDIIDILPTRLWIDVLEAANLGSGYSGCWSKADTLMGHALFVSPGCSESLLASGGGIQEDCVYFMTERVMSLHRQRKPEDDFFDCILYNMRDRTVVPLPLETAAVSPKDGPWHPTWVFPALN